MTNKRNGVTNKRDTLARARPLRGITLSRHGTASVTVPLGGRDSDRAPLRSDPVTITPGTAKGFEEKTAEHKARLAADPRFAALVAALPAERACCGTFVGSAHRATCQEAKSRREERTELMRRAKASFLGWAENNPEADPLEVQAARDFLAATAPLQRPLGTGEPCLPSCAPDLCRASPDGFCDEGAA